LFIRICSRAFVALAFSSALAAQSPVKPLPAAARPASLAFALSSAGGFATFDQDWPRTPFEQVAHLPAGEDGPHFDLDLFLEGGRTTSFQGAPGSMSSARAGWDGHIGWRTGEDTGLALNLHSEASFYSFTNATGLVPGSGSSDPLNDVYETSLGSTLCMRTGEHTAWYSSAALTFSGEDNASMGASMSVCALTGVRYEVREDLSIEAGLAVASMLADDPWVVPYFGFDWEMGGGWRLFASGPRVELSKQLAPNWSLAATASYELRQFRLNADNPVPSGVLRDQQIDLGLELAWFPRADTRISLAGGMTSWRQLQFYDENGNKISESEVDPVAYLGLRMHFGF